MLLIFLVYSNQEAHTQPLTLTQDERYVTPLAQVPVSSSVTRILFKHMAQGAAEFPGFLCMI